MPGIVIDIILIAVILLVGLIGMARGFFKSFLSLFGFIGSIIVAVLLREQIAKLLETLFGFESYIENVVTDKIGGMNVELVNFKTADSNELIKLVNNMQLNTILKGIFINILTSATIVEPVSVAELVAGPIAHFIAVGLGVIIASILIRVIVFILNATIGKLAKGKLFGKLNRTLGFVFGLVKGVGLVVVLMGLVTVLSLFPNINAFVTPYIESTTITEFCYDKVNDFVLEKVSGYSPEDLNDPTNNSGDSDPQGE